MKVTLKAPPTKWWQFLRRSEFNNWLKALHSSIGAGPFEVVKEVDDHRFGKLVYIRGPQDQVLDFGEQWINRLEVAQNE